MKETIWSETRAEIKKLFDAMPDSHKSQSKKLALTRFPELMRSIEEAKSKFDTETSIQQQAYWSSRYIALHKQLFRAISLHILTGSVIDSIRLPQGE